MATERWQRAKEVFQAVVTRAPEGRTAFLDDACRGDTDLREDVWSLLAAHDEAAGFLSRPASLDMVVGPEAGEPVGGIERIGPYQVLDTIAQGGMGTVYRAARDDDVFRKTVALKLIHGGRGSGRLERRFRQERQILAGLQHPNVAQVLDGGTTEDGRPYLVMEHVEGLSIARYCCERRLPTRERLQLFRTVCGAVHYAHQSGVVHRDLKPDNILVTADGTPKLLDFGIAKLLAAGVDPENAPTATLLPMMTPEYASPEQVKGEAVTAASDVYSLGVILYELLTGQRPYPLRTDSLQEIVRVLCDTDPPPPSVAVRSSPASRRAQGEATPAELRGDLDTIILKALAKEPTRRYASALDLAEDVRRQLDGQPVRARRPTIAYRAAKFVRRHRSSVALAGCVALLAGLGTAVLIGPLTRGTPNSVTTGAPTERSVAVLPFRQIGDDGANVLGVGMSDAVIRRLSRISGLAVRPIGSVMKFASAPVDPIVAGRELKVAVVLDGTLQRAADRVRLSVQLIDTQRGAVLWAQELDEAVSDVFTLQEVIAGQAARQLLPHLAPSAAPQAAGNRTSTEVQDLYLKGRFHYNQRTAEDMRQAVGYFEQAVAKDSSFAPAWAGLADAYGLMTEYADRSVADTLPRARAAALRALELDPDLAEAQSSLGWVHLIYDWRWPDAEASFRRSIEVGPGDSLTRMRYGIGLASRGLFDAGFQELREGRRLDPLSRPLGAALLRSLFMARRFEEALKDAMPVIEADPNYAEPHLWLGLSRVYLGSTVEGLAEVERACSLAPRNPGPLAALGWTQARLGKRSAALATLAHLQRGLGSAPISPYLLAEVYAGLGDRAAAVSQILAAKGEHTAYIPLRLAVDPRMEDVRKDTRIQALLAELGFDVPAKATAGASSAPP